jgi:hypothetical protein
MYAELICDVKGQVLNAVNWKVKDIMFHSGRGFQDQELSLTFLTRLEKRAFS